MRLARPALAAGLLLLGLRLPLAAQTEEVSVRGVELQPAEVTVGGKVELAVRVAHPDAFKAESIETAGDPRWDPLESSLEALPGGGTLARVSWAVFAVGQDMRPPAVKIWMKSPEGEMFPVEPQLPTLDVASVLTDGEEDLAAVKPPMSAPFETPWALASAVAAALALAGLAWWWLRRRRRAAEGVSAEPPVPPYEEAFGILSGLKESRLWLGERYREHYECCAHALRRYLERRYGLPVLERTTQEAVPMLRFHPSLRAHTDALRGIFSLCDAVKFAKVRPAEAEAEASLREALQFLETTKPQPAPEEDAEGGAPAASAGGG